MQDDTEKEKQPQSDAEGQGSAGKKQKKHLPLWAKILLGLLCAVAVLAGLVMLYIDGKLSLIRYSDGTISFAGNIDKTEDQDLDGGGLEHTEQEMELPGDDPFASEDVLNILLISTDERTDAVNDAAAFTHLNELDGTSGTTEFSEDARADSLILVSLNIKEDTIKLVSIERGTGVPIDLPEYEGEYDWITHTFRYGGAKLTMDTVEKCFGVQVDHYVRINFNSFVQIVDAVGGIDVDLTELEAKALNWEVPSNSMLIVNKVDPGLNHFDGYTALQYARLRKIDNDWQRVARQRTVIQAVLNQIKSASVLDLDNLLNTVLPLVQTNFKKSEITALLPQLPAFLGVDTEQMSLPAEGSYGVRTGMDDRLMYDPDWPVNRRILQRFLYGSTSDSDVRSYLRDNSATLDWEAGLTDEQFGNAAYSIFLAGETAGQTASYTTRQQMLVYLHEKQGVNRLLTDCGPGTALCLQKYLDTGDEDYLEIYMQALADTPRYNEDEDDFWRWLRRYNTAQSSPVQVVGIGVEAQQSSALAGLALLLKDDAALDEDLQPLAFLLRQQNPYAIDKLQAALDASYYHTRTLFGSDNWPMAKQILASIARTQGYLDAAAAEQPALLSAAMQADFAFARAQYPEEKFFGQFATAQVLQSDSSLLTGGFAAALCAGGADTAGQVCSIVPLYAGDDTQLFAGQSVLKNLLPASLKADTLISLDGPATPFDSQNGFFAEGGAEDAQPATAFFQKFMTLLETETCAPYGTEADEELFAASSDVAEEGAEAEQDTAQPSEETAGPTPNVEAALQATD